MRANCIIFPQPTVKVSSVLPPTRRELDEVLAILWTGHIAPVLADFKRAPVLVRQKVVYEALLWLKLNHPDYNDVIISENNLSEYSDNIPPVHISHLPTENLSEPHNLAVFQSEDEIATEDGPCPFAVHGLMGADLEELTADQQKYIALQHLHSGNKVLAIGHGQYPISTFENPKYLAAMFPWLFPYGLGVIGNKNIIKPVSRDKHVEWLLMYHDLIFRALTLDEDVCVKKLRP
ncbi:hypothetical protein PUNSTDRAFT_113051 [Punctularia strigosozonata HHB-11173 SS5]|uniref:uncharacterized protein n=1 Tax=Punctularia strigosozonata (strain HHB-11173) TaxID=741275 RepID=UPI00044178D8|nr:uncharacterized protein PUNSTDRAFT_113051 [Punctularia strigosozonata HHB-11173 SS5]EIN09613.1 hypothetical protein PUNSTDRAFT_113051 [Punctularia strigosozonata HHB-11173 SS5]